MGRSAFSEVGEVEPKVAAAVVARDHKVFASFNFKVRAAWQFR